MLPKRWVTQSKTVEKLSKSVEEMRYERDESGWECKPATETVRQTSATKPTIEIT